MKSFCAIVLVALILLACTSALADVELSYNPALTNQSLLNPIQQTEYVNWKLYQPTSSEIVGADMTNDSHFQDRRFWIHGCEDNGEIYGMYAHNLCT